MTARDGVALESLGLGGDGDEVDAITAVEVRFGVVLDYDDAKHWVTAGDVFDSLLKALPADLRDRDATWQEFAIAISRETEVDAARVGPDTLLLGLPIREHVRRWIKRTLGRSG